MEFPKGFLFGVATAAYQIEGAVNEDGRGPSIWDVFSHTPGRVHNGDTGDVACDHYHRLESDLDLLAAIGVRAYRFSIAWPRVQPGGSGSFNQKGLDFYRSMLEGLHARGIVPMATLYHWDLPQPLEDAGGWRSRDTAKRYADYVAGVADALGDAVPFWVTVNEPWCSAFVGHLEGRHAPGMANLEAALHAAHHLLVAHGLGTQALRAARLSGQVGVVLNLSDVHAADARRPEDVAAAARIDGNENRWFLDPLFKKSYPSDLLAWYGQRADLTPLQEEDLAVIAEPIDFLGINYYEYHRVTDDPNDPVHRARKIPPEPPTTDTGIGVRPKGLAHILERVASSYTGLPIYITENGAAYDDQVGPDGTVNDRRRVEYLSAHFDAARGSMQAGVDLRGYFVWSMLDNFEWAEGYSRRFGIVYVDFPTQRRILKSSAYWYRELIASQQCT